MSELGLKKVNWCIPSFHLSTGRSKIHTVTKSPCFIINLVLKDFQAGLGLEGMHTSLVNETKISFDNTNLDQNSYRDGQRKIATDYNVRKVAMLKRCYFHSSFTLFPLNSEILVGTTLCL